MLPPLSGPVLTAAEMRAAEAAAMAAGLSVDTLMARAGQALAEAVWRFGGGRPVLVLCGPGNNGGDGYVAARLLQAKGLFVRVAALGSPSTDVAKRAGAQWQGPVEELAKAAPAPVLLDCLFGTGLSRPLEEPIATHLCRHAQAAQTIIAADLPSGVGTDDGSSLGAVAAQITIALGALKPAHVLQPAAALCGHVIVADIGITATSNAKVITRPHLPPPGPSDHKYSRGLVTVIAGAMPGAARLAATAAARSGAGYVVLAGEEESSRVPLAIVHRPIDAALADERMAALVIGPGLGRTVEARAQVNEALGQSEPLVLDADALHLIDLSQLKARAGATILTPHAGEFAALFAGLGLTGSKLDQARAAAKASGCVVVFKGADTVIAAPDGRAAVAARPPSWLATAGTGDVLAGIIATMLARGLEPLAAAEAGVWLHSRAAALAGPGMIADDLLTVLPQALGQAV